MRRFVVLGIHLFVTFLRFLRPVGVHAVTAESLLLKHQLLVSQRARCRAPILTTFDRVFVGLTTMFINPKRIPKVSVLLMPATVL